MIRIGLVDLDTSHPRAFTRILRDMPGVTVAALWDGRDVWPDGYDAAFAAEEKIPVVCSRLEEMPDHVDAAMIHGTNWDTHLEKALPFLKEGKPVLIDKPIVGRERDCVSLLELQARYGTPVYGGSSLRYAAEVTALRERIGSRTGLHMIVASGPGDFFSYGIHTTEMLQGCIGTGIRSVRCAAGHRGPLFRVTYDDGFAALLQLQTPHYEWSLAAYTGSGLQTTVVNPDRLYEPFLKEFIASIGGAPAADRLTGPVEAVRVHLAAAIALTTGDEVFLDRLPADAAFDGAAFAAAYAAEKRQQSQQR
jgi:hypothetical protein